MQDDLRDFTSALTKQSRNLLYSPHISTQISVHLPVGSLLESKKIVVRFVANCTVMRRDEFITSIQLHIL